MVDCTECNTSFEDGDNVNECSECDEAFCDDCKEEHNCMDDFGSHENTDCRECGNIELDMLECPSCNIIVCEDCQDKHKNKHKEDIDFTTQKYEQYITEKTADEL